MGSTAGGGYGNTVRWSAGTPHLRRLRLALAWLMGAAGVPCTPGATTAADKLISP